LTCTLAAGTSHVDFDRHARGSADALVGGHGRPPSSALVPYLKDPQTAAASAVLAGHLGWTELPPTALDARAALWNDARLEGAGEGLAEADAALARALAVAPALYRFGSPSRRDALVGALLDPSPLRRRLARAALAGAEPLDAARRVARLAATSELEGEAEQICSTLRACLDRVVAPAQLDRLTVQIARERADAWSRSSATLERRAASLERSLERYAH